MGLFDSYLDATTSPDTSQDALIAKVLAQLAPTPPISTDNTPPPPAFGAGATPFQYAGPGSLNVPPAAPSFGAGATPFQYANATMPGAGATPPVVAADDDDEDPAPAAPAQASPIAVGGYQMPRVGPAAAFTPQPTAPVQQAPQPAALPAALQAPQATNPLMAVAQGLHSIARGGSLYGAISGNPDDPRSLAQQKLQQQYQALVNAGVPHQQAVLAVLDPEAGKTIIAQALGPHNAENLGQGWIRDPQTGKVTRAYTPEQNDNYVTVQTGEDGIGGKTFQKMNKATGEMTPIAGAPGADNGGGIGDMSKTGEAYAATLPKKQLLTARGMLDYTLQPPSSFAASKPYWQGMIAAAKNIDPTWDENKWAAGHTMTVDLAKSGNSTMGGILSNGESAFSHLAEYTKSAADQGNASHDFPLGGYIAHGQNYIGNSLGGSDTMAKVKAINDNLGHYGQESTKLYAGTGGGVEERTNALKEMNAGTTSGEEAAAYAEKEKGLMLDRLNAKFQQIRDTFGDEKGNAIIAKKMPTIQKNIATIDANIAKLRGGGTGAAGGTAPTGVKWSVVQ